LKKRARMARWIFLVCFLAPALVFAGFWEEFDRALSQSSDIESSTLNLLNAREKTDAYGKWFLPKVLFQAGKSNPFQLNADGIDGMDFQLSAQILNVYGFAFGISFPFELDLQDISHSSAGSLRITVSSQDLVNDYSAEQKEALASYLDALFNFSLTHWNMLAEVALQIASCYENAQNLEITRQKLSLYESNLAAEKDATMRLELQKQVLSTRKQLLNLQAASCENGGTSSQEAFEEMLGQLGAFLSPLHAALPLHDPADQEPYLQRLDVQAQNLREQAETSRNNSSFTPYLPDLSASFQVEPFEPYSWSLEVSGSWDIYDPGRQNEVAQRQATVQRKKGAEKLSQLATSYQKERLDVEQALLDEQLALLECTEKEQELQVARQLVQKGLARQEESQLAELAFREAELALQKVRLTILLEQMDLVPYGVSPQDWSLPQLETHSSMGSW